MCSVTSDSLQSHGLQPTRLLCPWDFPGQNTGVRCHFLLQGIFPTQRSNLGPCVSCIGRWMLYHWHHLEIIFFKKLSWTRRMSHISVSCRSQRSIYLITQRAGNCVWISLPWCCFSSAVFKIACLKMTHYSCSCVLPFSWSRLVPVQIGHWEIRFSSKLFFMAATFFPWVANHV